MIGALEYMILSSHPEHALEVGISLIKGKVNYISTCLSYTHKCCWRFAWMLTY